MKSTQPRRKCTTRSIALGTAILFATFIASWLPASHLAWKGGFSCKTLVKIPSRRMVCRISKRLKQPELKDIEFYWGKCDEYKSVPLLWFEELEDWYMDGDLILEEKIPPGKSNVAGYLRWLMQAFDGEPGIREDIEFYREIDPTLH